MQTKILEEKRSEKRKCMTTRRAEYVSFSDEINFVPVRNMFRSSGKQRFCFRKSAFAVYKYAVSAPFIQKSCINIRKTGVNKPYFGHFVKVARKQKGNFFIVLSTDARRLLNCPLMTLADGCPFFCLRRYVRFFNTKKYTG